MKVSKGLTTLTLLFISFSITAKAENPCSPIIPDGAIWKFDQYPGIEIPTTGVTPTQGAPNFRQIQDQPVFGLAQPTVNALPQILERIETKSHNSVVWVNLRQEPIMYINGRSFTLRDPRHPFANLVNAGATPEKVNQIEVCLEKQLKDDAKKNGGMLDLYDESKDGKVINLPEKLDTTLTVQEVFAGLNKQGHNILFFRLPITDEKSPTTDDLEKLFSISKLVGPDVSFVANCHAGRGRTTTTLAAFYIAHDKMPADEAIDKVGVLYNLRDAIHKAKNPSQQKDYQDRYDILLSFSNYVRLAN